MKTLQQILADTDLQKVGLGHFNISDLVALKAVYLGQSRTECAGSCRRF